MLISTVSEREFSETFQRAFRKRVGRHGISTQNLARLVGESHRTVKAWQAGTMRPKPHQLLNLSRSEALGAPFLNEILFPVGLGGAHALSGSACFFRVGVNLSGWLLQLNHAAEDGVIDHREQAVLTHGLREIRAETGKAIHQLKKPLRVVA